MTPLSLQRIERDFFKRKNPLRQILSISLDLLGARHSGLLYGTNDTHMRFLPASDWDRGVMDRFDARGLAGLVLRWLGTYIVRAKKLSPVFFYKTDADGRTQENDGIIAYVLRNCADYYKKGINVVICPDTEKVLKAGDDNGSYCYIPFFIYNGHRISKPKTHIKVDLRIVRQFKSSNSIYIILPDYGIMVINTADKDLLALENDAFVREDDLRHRLDMLIRLVEASSLAYLGQLKGRKGAELLWRKEEHLRKAYADLAESEGKYRDLYENAPNAYLSITPEGTILRCNRQAEHLSGFSRQELVGKNAYDMDGDRQAAAKNFDTILETLEQGRRVKDLELRIIRKDGKSIWISLCVDAVRDKAGMVREMRAMALDISERKALENQLFHAQKMEAIGTLARGIAHDFNNVLSPVSGYAQMLLLDANLNDEEKEQIQVILDCARHAKALVSRILTFSRQQDQKHVRIKVGDALAESMVLVRSFLPSTIKVNTRINRYCGYIMVDPVQFHQVIMNLATNSYHAMGTGGTLEVSAARQAVAPGDPDPDGIGTGDYVCITVSDTGDGIDDAVMSKIFEPYFTTKAEGEGSGIGLSVVHGIVKGHGGEIRVSSVPGQGTCFRILLPVFKTKGGSRSSREHEKKDAPAMAQGTESVLLVDDDSKIIALHTRILERLGYRVTCFKTSPEALDAYREDPGAYDLVITDYTMPDMDGFELARKICAVDPAQPVMVCTGLGDHINLRKEAAGCVAGFVRKPVDIKRFSVLIRETMDKAGKGVAIRSDPPDDSPA
ncbi:MAG: ATP-binding protein [Desulfobacter sp.]